MNFILFIAKKISRSETLHRSISSPAVNIGSTAVGLGITIMILSVAVIRGFKQQINNKLRNLTSDVVVMPYQGEDDITSRPISVRDDTLHSIQQISILKYVEPVCIKNGILKIKEENEGVLFKGVMQNYHWDLLKAYLVEGTFPSYSDTFVSKEVVISKKLADRMNLKLNQKIIVYFINKIVDEEGREKIEYRSRDLYVKGIIHPQLGELDNQLVYGDVKMIQRVNNWKVDQFSQIELYAKEPASSDAIIEQVIDKIPYNYQLVRVEELYSNIFNWLEMIDVNAVIIIVLMLIVASVNMVSALIILILEKVSLIGILKALGMNNWNIKNIFLLLSLKILFKGLLYGNVLSVIIMLLQQHFHIFTLDSDAYYVNYIPVEWNFMEWLLLNIGTVLVCLVCMYVPTYLISKMLPSEILRWE